MAEITNWCANIQFKCSSLGLCSSVWMGGYIYWLIVVQCWLNYIVYCTDCANVWNCNVFSTRRSMKLLLLGKLFTANAGQLLTRSCLVLNFGTWTRYLLVANPVSL